MTETRRACIVTLRLFAYLMVASTSFLVLLGQPRLDMAAEPQVSGSSAVAADLVAQHDCDVYGYDIPDPTHAVVDTGDGVRYTSADAAAAILYGEPGTIYAWCP